MTGSNRIYFFGCWSNDRKGHFLYDSTGRTVRNPVGLPCTTTPDGVFVGTPEELYKPRIWHTEGWTVYAMWDRSADRRPASNSVFILEGHHTAQECWDKIVLHFPTIAKRLVNAKEDE